MVNGTQLQIADTGLNKVGGSATYTAVNSGAYVGLRANVLRGEMTSQTEDNASKRYDTGDTSKLSYHSNALSALIPPRFTIQAVFDTTVDAAAITHLWNMWRSLGIKKIKGGLGTISTLPDKFDDSGADAIYVVIKNITFSEATRNSLNLVNMTIQLEQVN